MEEVIVRPHLKRPIEHKCHLAGVSAEALSQGAIVIKGQDPVGQGLGVSGLN
jgi:hypothetical protein